MSCVISNHLYIFICLFYTCIFLVKPWWLLLYKIDSVIYNYTVIWLLLCSSFILIITIIYRRCVTSESLTNFLYSDQREIFRILATNSWILINKCTNTLR